MKWHIISTACNTDDMIRKDFKDEYISILEEVPYGKKYIFPNGFHPAAISNDIEFAKVIKTFLK